MMTKKQKAEDIKLYELTGIYSKLCDELEDGGGELTPELEEALETTGALLSEKLENIGKLVKTLEGDADFWTARQKAFDAEAKRMKARADARLARIEGLKRYASNCLSSTGMQKMQTESFTFSVQEDHSVTVTGADIDPMYVRIKEEVDKKAILEAWKALPEDKRNDSREFKGARVVTKLGLRIK